MRNYTNIEYIYGLEIDTFFTGFFIYRLYNIQNGKLLKQITIDNFTRSRLRYLSQPDVKMTIMKDDILIQQNLGEDSFEKDPNMFYTVEFFFFRFRRRRCYGKVCPFFKSVFLQNIEYKTIDNVYDAYVKEGDDLTYMQKYDEALMFYDKAIDINHFEISAYNNKGIVLEELEKFEEARQKNFVKCIIFKFICFLKRYDVTLKCFDVTFDSGLTLNCLESKNINSFIKKGISLLIINYFDEALNYFETLLTFEQLYEVLYFKATLQIYNTFINHFISFKKINQL